MSAHMIEARRVEHSMLKGRSVLITRTTEGNLIEREKLERLGAKVIELATIKISPPSSWEKLDQAISSLDKFDWIVFTSANGVRSFFERVSKNFTKELSLKFACVGSATRNTLENLGFTSSFEPSEFLTDVLGRELATSFDLRHKKILLVRAEDTDHEVARKLGRAGSDVWEAPAYSTHLQKQEFSQWILDEVTDITLMSPSSVAGLISSIPVKEIRSRRIRVYCIGPVTAKAAEEKGFNVHSVAETHTLDGLIQSMVESS